MLCQCKELKASQLYDAVFASLFTYDFDENLLKAFCECWSPMTNTLHTSVGEISITPWDLHTLGGLPCAGSFYDEVVSCARELEGANEQGQPFLPASCHYLFKVYCHIQHLMKGQGRVSVNAWIRKEHGPSPTRDTDIRRSKRKRVSSQRGSKIYVL